MSPGQRLGLSALRVWQWIARTKLDALARFDSRTVLEQLRDTAL
jgi:hypothetical protein